MGSSASLDNSIHAIGKIASKAFVPKTLRKAGDKLVPDVEAPTVPDPVVMADPLQQQAARARSLIAQLSRRGRDSTILTGQDGGKLGS